MLGGVRVYKLVASWGVISVSSTILNTAIGHAHSLDTAIHEYGIRQSMISRLSMDLGRQRKRSLKLRVASPASHFSQSSKVLPGQEPTEELVSWHWCRHHIATKTSAMTGNCSGLAKRFHGWGKTVQDPCR